MAKNLILEILQDPDLSYEQTMAMLLVLSLYLGFAFYSLARKESQKYELPIISYDN